MDYLIDERARELIKITIDENRANDSQDWQHGKKHRGSPTDVSELIRRHSQGVLRLFVQDRVLCDAIQKGEDAGMSFLDYREALASSSLRSITPLANPDRSFNPRHEPDSYSVCTYGSSPATEIRMDPPQEVLHEPPEGSWQVPHPDLKPERRLDCWHYRDRFRELRKAREGWVTQRFCECFDPEIDRAGRKPLAKRPSRGELRWLSSAQIHEHLHAIVPSRVRDWGESGRDVPIEPGDLLASMAGFTQVKLARYDGPRDDATRSLYLLQFRPRQKDQSPQDAAAVWLTLTSDDFLDQIRMELSDRVMKPLTEHFPLEARVPPPLGITPGIARAVEVITKLALGSNHDDPLTKNLRLVEAALESDDVPWPGKWACLRRIWQFLGEFDKDGEVLVLSKDSAVGLECVAGLRQVNVRVGDPRLFRASDRGLVPALARAAAKAPAVVSLTSANTPLRLASEQIGASHALDIAGGAHRFALYSADGSVRDFPARQFVEHLFSETGKLPESVDVCGKDACALGKDLREVLADPPIATKRQVIDRLVQLDSLAEPFARFLPEAAPTSRLDRVRPALTAFSAALLEQEQPAFVGVVGTAVPRLKRRQKKFEFGKFVTLDGGLAKKIEDFKSMFKNALDDVRDGLRMVIPLLIEGETGCGKDELVNYLEAEFLGEGRFMRFGVAASPTLIVSQLFGHMKGAFTDANVNEPGVFGEAVSRKCPVFLNEVNSFPLEVQFRLLTILDKGEFTPLGGKIEDGKKFRGVVIAASNEKIDDLVEKKMFRSDLRMRLDAAALVLSPLKYRLQDIELIFDRVCDDQAKTDRVRRPVLEDHALKRLRAYAWPGNGRELECVIRRAFLLREPKIDERFLESHYPQIYHGCAPFATVVESGRKEGVPPELSYLEDELRRQQGRSSTQLYRDLRKRLGRKEPKTGDMRDWLERRHELINKFRSDLPRIVELQKQLSDKRTRRKQGIS